MSMVRLPAAAPVTCWSRWQCTSWKNPEYRKRPRTTRLGWAVAWVRWNAA